MTGIRAAGKAVLKGRSYVRDTAWKWHPNTPEWRTSFPDTYVQCFDKKGGDQGSFQGGWMDDGAQRSKNGAF